MQRRRLLKTLGIVPVASIAGMAGVGDLEAEALPVQADTLLVVYLPEGATADDCMDVSEMIANSVSLKNVQVLTVGGIERIEALAIPGARQGNAHTGVTIQD